MDEFSSGKQIILKGINIMAKYCRYCTKTEIDAITGGMKICNGKVFAESTGKRKVCETGEYDEFPQDKREPYIADFYMESIRGKEKRIRGKEKQKTINNNQINLFESEDKE